jgi:hypothetical protein
MNIYENKNFDAELIGKQQLLIKSQLSQRNSLVAKQQLAIKAALASQHKNMSQQAATRVD